VVALATDESKILKRTILALSFVVALCAAGLGMSSTAQAHGCGYGVYRPTYFAAPAPYYGYGAPRLSHYHDFDDHHHHHHHDHDSHVFISFGF
jgi:hypothetical protein